MAEDKVVQENAFVDWLRRHFAAGKGVQLGIGDDAAVLACDGRDLVVCTDLICDGVHFDSESCQPEQIGYKALAVNLSDLAAMAAQPVAAFVSILLPERVEHDFGHRLMLGMAPLADNFTMSVAGGDTNVWAGSLVISVAVTGHVTSRGPLRRGGARPGDILLVTGTLGGSILEHHFEFTPRVREALLLHHQYDLSAGMDLSDGLAMDLRRLAAASGCGAEIESSQIPISLAAKQIGGMPEQSLQHALGDGEDFELLLAAPPAEATKILADQPLEIPLTAIGRCTEQHDLWLVVDGQKHPLPELGYEHGGGDAKQVVE